MAKRLKNKLQAGFSLLEVLIALAIFSVYATAIIFRVSNNVTGSMQMAEDITLHNLAELKMNEVLIGNKEFTNVTENEVDTGKFDIEGYKEFQYEVKIRKMKFPDLTQIMGNSEEENQQDQSNNAIQKLIFDKMKKNIEEIIWQVSVTVTNPATEYSYQLNSWINKSNVKIDTNFSF
ncbi:MAG: prepilin-type N-terminal cleavage/methylation domain-containing protein [Bacteriovoracaceae bacterium]|jgi:prepilin-type N-terminal cleavage/methylation domain-containing protein|nr:hypothetical protein [Halobacteriovoraceae bacterium]MDP7320460.1 prepilin-type N-terminal cleavage/methylation domain-containing protein [Bacteriovoracaceae bacterium]|tara:strand:+ start:381 stop:911 length:531 start_codon:yes stop_codon:yes gene_type:complete